MERTSRVRIRLALLAVLVLAIAALLLAVRGTFAPTFPASAASGEPISIGASKPRIAGRIYFEGNPIPGAPLVVVLHGDAPFRKPGYQYRFASTVSQLLPGVRVAALLRPGYADPYGAKSDGNRGFAAGENYTPDVALALADAISALRTQYGAKTVVLVGHSGGAAIAADIAALRPGLVKQLFLVSCPCDVPAFRHHMAMSQLNPLWLVPAKSLSPMETLKQMSCDMSIIAVSGAEDRTTLPQYARAYTRAARSRGIKALLLTLSGKGHEILNEDAVTEIVADSVKKLL
ncbi:alpha/beta hydrolase [Silvibacterium acidisoli]|uniref:alpha/beta hydrolase n=1 Tax=Acidobacteriaceae bacterium ZG23-2 TaxID=2883246 RepID=UPI00406BF1F5